MTTDWQQPNLGAESSYSRAIETLKESICEQTGRQLVGTFLNRPA